MPGFVGPKIGLHPVWLIFALFVFSYLFGLVGTLVAVPLAAAIGVLVRFALQVYLASSVYKGDRPDRAAGIRCCPQGRARRRRCRSQFRRNHPQSTST